MNRKSFKQQFEGAMNEIEVDIDLKRTLASEFDRQPKKSFFTWSKALFVTPVLTVLMIVFVLFPSDSLLVSPRALAQAFQNIFNIESFESTFGMPNDGKLHHRSITRNFTGMPVKDSSELKEGKITETVDLWSDGENVRSDHFYFTDQPAGAFSILANIDTNVFCHFGEEFSSDIAECNPLDIFQKSNMSTMIGNNAFIPQFKETLLGDFNEFKLEPFKIDRNSDLSEALRDNWYTFSFSTLEPLPINANQVWEGSRPLAWDEAGFINDLYPITEFKDPSFYNHFKNGKYWHKYLLQRSDNVVYFQFHTTHEAIESVTEIFNYTKDEIKTSSMLYKIDLKSGKIIPVTENEVTDEQNFPKAYSVLGLIKEGLMRSTFKPANYVINNSSDYNEPLIIQTIKKNGQKIVSLKYLIPNSPEVDPSLILEGKNYIYFYMNEAQDKFLGYSIQNEQGEEIQSVWIEDQILPQEDKEKVFDQEEWAKKWL